MSQLTADIAPHRAAFLRLEQAASAAYNNFAYRDESQSEVVRGLLFDRGVAEFAPGYSRLLVEDGAAIGMVSCLSAEALSKARMRCAWALARSGLFEADLDLQERLALAGQALLRTAPDEFYLSRIAVCPGAGVGHAQMLLDHCWSSAAESGALRIVLEVAADNVRALRFYQRNLFEEIGRAVIEHSRTGRKLSYIHMARSIQER
jgi:ribosomal protein S18 acetylase RimI-like enzyme